VASVPGLPSGRECKPPRVERPWLDRRQSAECRALEALAALTPEERTYFGTAAFGALGEPPSSPGSGSAQPVSPEVAAARSADAKLGLPNPGTAADGPNGIADLSDLFGPPPAQRAVGVTAFPNVITLAATWDRNLSGRFGRALGREFRGKGLSGNLGPTLNLIRTWHGGRSAETFGEDPFLIGELAVPEIRALQREGVVATIKHFAGNNQEFGRVGIHPDMAGIDARISEKALHEIYLPHFKAAVQRGRAGGVMCSYNKVNGEFACNNSWLLGQLREWGFDGTIVPDAGYAQREAVAAARAGVDAATPVAEVRAAVARGDVDAHYFDRKVYYALVTRFRHGLYDSPPRAAEEDVVSNSEHVNLAREIAAAGAVLLKNAGGLLPLDVVKSVAVVGADAGPDAVVMETGSAHVRVGTLDVPSEAIRKRAGSAVRVTYTRGSAGVHALPSLPESAFTPASGQGHGLDAVYYGTPFYSAPVLRRIDARIEWGARPGIPPPPEGVVLKKTLGTSRFEPWSALWSGTLTPPATGTYTFSLTGSGTAELSIGGKLIATIQRADFPATTVGTIELTAGRPQPVLVKYDTASSIFGAGLRLGWQTPDDRIARAVEAARQADVAVVFAGEELGEGYDKIRLALPGDQNALIEAVAAANPRTVVVLHTSTAVAMPWLDKVAAVIEAWYPGQEAGSSIAAVLFGDVNPSGRLPITFPRDETQGPAQRWWEYPGDGHTVQYSEGVLVGYRWYDATGQEPLFAFGHGLSYTTFDYSDIKISGSGDTRTVQVRVRNTGKRSGSEVVQLYVGMPDEAAEPPKQLKGFEKIALAPGESRTVSLPLPDASISVYDEATRAWRIFPGDYSVMVGASSRDIRQSTRFMRPQ
jgi:beta-glucosidase